MPPEEAESLQRELTAIASPAWAALLFHKDFKRHLEAAEQLVANLADLLEEVQASLDLILRWAVLRICDGNMQASRVEGGWEGDKEAGMQQGVGRVGMRQGGRDPAEGGRVRPARLAGANK